MVAADTVWQKGRVHGGTGSVTQDDGWLERRRELADFLRARRAALSPASAGFERGSRRRTPGLRREEVATRAGVSVAWYVRLEQGRADRPSGSVLDALARALRLSPDERAHMYALGRGERAPEPRTAREETDAGLLHTLDALAPDVAGIVLGRGWDVLAWNRAACELLVDFDEVAEERRNLVELTFLDPRLRERYPDWLDVAPATLASFRASVGRHLDVPEIAHMVQRLTADPLFAQWWSEHRVQEKRSGLKRFRDDNGRIRTLRFDSVYAAHGDQRLVIYTAA